ncbi:MAG: KR domain-containing protein [Rhodobacteraceae bacterium]|nr:KR domain-containing protein [Paracoccaceae bacterium]
MTKLGNMPDTTGDIAIVGLSVAVPGAQSVSQFWDNLKNGVESIQVLDGDALKAAGERPELLADPHYVPAAALLEGFDQFDAEFFGFSPKEAAILDPQHRKFLETAWEAMESAGHPPESINGPIGVYAGCGMGSYFYFNICSNRNLVDDVGMFLLRHTGNDKDFLSTRVSHVFDLKGPSINIQTACSTSLVAVHYACQALRSGECDMALAGGVTIELPQGRGYLYKENEILSPDGHCHAFDHRAQGTVFGSGAGAVALRRLEDAIADGDHIWAVIKGSAVNNDGAAKAGYLAPSVDGQAAAVRQALDAAKVGADTIGYVECHGTGTYLGDPIEVSALTEAFAPQAGSEADCRIGSVKTNIGHLDTAAGIAGLVKTTLALHHGQIPPSLGYEAPNPAIDFDHSPFQVNDHLSDWTTTGHPRRAGVNALGVGGTNAHAVLEEAPVRAPSEESDFPFHPLCLSAHSKAALDGNSAALAAYLRANPDVDLADVAFTLKNGRRGFDKRRVLVAETALQAAELLEQGDARQVFTHDKLGDAPDVVFMFPGGGAQYAGMARDLYETEPVFADWMDRGLEHLQKKLDYDPKAIWLPEEDQLEAAETKLLQPSVQLPLIMIIEYALAQLWISWGVRPTALVGHSMGENTAACLAGVMSFENCIDLVLLRGQLFDTVPAGGMLSISASLEDVQAMLPDDLDIASVNAPLLVAVSGPQAALEHFADMLSAQDIDHQRIPIDIAAHSRMLDPILQKYGEFLAKTRLETPKLQILSNRTGLALTPEQATDPTYWVEQLRNTVHFASCLDSLSSRKDRVYLEVGPGKALSSLAQMHGSISSGQVLSSLRHPDQDVADDAYFVGVIGRLWACGVTADWDQIWGEVRRHRLPLPTYAFQRSQYFIEPAAAVAETTAPLPQRHDDLSDWGYRPSWRPRLADCALELETELSDQPLNWLVFEDDIGLATSALARLEEAGHVITRVRPGDTFARLTDGSYVLATEQGNSGYEALLQDLEQRGQLPDRIAHFWMVTREESFRPGSSFFDRNLEMGFYSLTHLAQALGSVELPGPLHILAFTSGASQQNDEALPYPEKAMIAGPMGVIPREFPGVTCAMIDIDLPDQTLGWLDRLQGRSAPDRTDRLLEELLAEPQSLTAVWRGERRLEQGWRPTKLDTSDASVFRNGGTYLITGGYGGIGLTLAADLMRDHNANVVLLSRDGLPARDHWDRFLRSHGPSHRLSQRIRAVMDLEDIGSGRILPLTADVCNSEQMQAAKTQAEAAFGPTTGVIHAAGHIDDSPILGKSDAQIAQVFAPKISGLRVLDALFPDGSIELMVLFSSSSTVTRPAGQVDYVAANEYLNAYAKHRSGGQTRVVAIDWGVWSDVGMAAEAMARRAGADTLPARAPSTQPLWHETGFNAKGQPIYAAHLSSQGDWILNEHRIADGTALMPGTGYIELLAQAVQAQGVSTGFEIRDLYFLQPFIGPEDGERELVLSLQATDEGYSASFHGTLPEGGYALHAQARLVLNDATAPQISGDKLESHGDLFETAAGSRLKSPQEKFLRFGPRWQVLDQISLGEREGVARLSLSPSAQGDGCLLHPGLMDLSTGWAMELIPGYQARSLWVPVSYGAIQVFGPLPNAIVSHVQLSGTPHDGFATFDIVLCDEQGKVAVAITGFNMKRLEGALTLPDRQNSDASAADLGLEIGGSSKPLSSEEQRLLHNIANGIRESEGPEALQRALSKGLPQIVVSSLDLPALIQQTEQGAAQDSAPEQSFERPQLETEFIAPRNAVEEQLADQFATLLGVAQVGVEDSFFDLGGHSLIAVRLFAQIKRAFDVEFPISLLFEAPSVAGLAERIIQRTGGGVSLETPGTEDPGKAKDATDFVHLVKLHPGDGTGKRPFFLVAGMFGNVLNLRQLALLVGRDRPVYGLQARGLIGEEAPHISMSEAARDYLDEVRRIQPHGPYHFGGFSGGGITAYEMAQQVTQAGEDVASLVLLDTPLPLRPTLTRKDKALIKLHELRRKGIGYLSEWARTRIAWELSKRRGSDQSVSQTPEFNNSKIEAAFRQAIGSYQVATWDGPLTLFRPPLDRHWKVSEGQYVSAAREYVFDDNDWTRWAVNTQVVEVPGDHDSMVLVPNVSVLADHVRSVLDASEPSPNPHSPALATAAE